MNIRIGLISDNCDTRQLEHALKQTRDKHHPGLAPDEFDSVIMGCAWPDCECEIPYQCGEGTE